MWVKRYIIIIPALARPFVEQEWTLYSPTWVEWAITAGAFAAFMLAYTLFSKFFPIISRYEIAEGEELAQSIKEKN